MVKMLLKPEDIMFVPNESTKEGMSKSAITIGTKGQNCGDEGSILSNSHAL